VSLPLPDQSKPETPFFKRNVAKLLGYIVERWYPDHAFHGARYAQAFNEFDRKHDDPRHRAAASSLISAVHGAGQSHLTLDIGNLIYNNEIMGDWELEIRRKGHEKAEPTPEAPAEPDAAKAAALTLLNTVAASGVQRRRVRIDGSKWRDAPEGRWTLTVERTPEAQEKTS
jgi:hypothetical protein